MNTFRPANVKDSLAEFGFYEMNTGGECKSFVRTGDKVEVYLGLQIDPAYLPKKMSDPIRVSILENGNELFTMHFKSVTEFLEQWRSTG